MWKPFASSARGAAAHLRILAPGALAAVLAAACATAGPLGAQEPDREGGGTEGAPDEPRAVNEAMLPIGLVEFFGLRTLEEDSLRVALGLGPELEEGLAASQPVIDRAELPLLAVRLSALPGVAAARMETVCCHEGRAILFVGIREEGDEPRGGFRREAGGAARLPEPVLREYRDLVRGLLEAAPRQAGAGETARVDSLSADSLARAYRPRFGMLAENHLPTLREVLVGGADAEERAIAALLLAHAPDGQKSEVAADLARAMGDPDPRVRENAARSLAAIALHALQHAEEGIRMPVEPLAELLGSTVWSDREAALSLLIYLAPPGADEVLSGLRRRAWSDLAEMARWRSPGHALPAFVLLGRMAGLSDEETLQAWREGRREEVIERARSPSP